VPRFVSLRSGEVFARTGPGKQYPVRWVYRKKDLPVEIILEYEGWRKIRDRDGGQGWVHQTLLSGKRTAIIDGEENITIYRHPRSDARAAAAVEPSAIVEIEACDNAWCNINAAGYEGWILRKYLWGVYQNENFE
jgi:SH3-like domain-containing protein